ncbi:MAG: shikimate kinase [Microthrixaceae bacterium]|nr:shikimate kinase [Microthrixaceae bacterium]
MSSPDAAPTALPLPRKRRRASTGAGLGRAAAPKPADAPTPISLVGLPGSGKSTVAQLLAQLLQRRWVDLDERIELVSGRSIPELFAEGEDRFRTVETEVLRGVLAVPTGVVVATGGGIVTIGRNREVLTARSTVVWLDVPVEVLLDRLRADATERPLLDDDDPAAALAGLALVRRPLYEEVAAHRVDASGDPEQVANAVERLLAPPVASTP